MAIQPTVFIVDDDEKLRSSLDLLFRSAGYQTKSYESGETFLADYNPDLPGCLILDLCMTGMTGLELQEEMKKREIRIPHILISGYAEVPKVVQAVKTGAVDFLEKPFLDDQLLKCVRLAIEQDLRNRHQSVEQSGIRSRVKSLSPRESQVLNLLITGKRTKEIASKLEISPKTVDIHRANVLKKTEAGNVVELLRMIHKLEV